MGVHFQTDFEHHVPINYTVDDHYQTDFKHPGDAEFKMLNFRRGEARNPKHIRWRTLGQCCKALHLR